MTRYFRPPTVSGVPQFRKSRPCRIRSSRKIGSPLSSASVANKVGPALCSGIVRLARTYIDSWRSTRRLATGRRETGLIPDCGYGLNNGPQPLIPGETGCGTIVLGQNNNDDPFCSSTRIISGTVSRRQRPTDRPSVDDETRPLITIDQREPGCDSNASCWPLCSLQSAG